MRFSTLSVQHYWIDEAVTVALLHLDFGQMLHTIPATESTPPLYYVLAWGWTRIFGTGEFGLRSLSALAGTAAVPACFAAARQFVSERAALVAAALAAVSPVLVWYSQEARAYSLLVLLATLSLLFFGRTLHSPSRGTLALWAAACVLALATHYFASFLVLGEAGWLLARGPRRAATAAACAPIALAVGLLAPLAAHQSQQGHLGFIGTTPLGTRFLETAKVFVSGQTGIRVAHLPLVGVLLFALALLLALKSPRYLRARMVPLAAVALGAVALPLILALAGRDYVDPRNLLPAWPALAVLAAAGLADGRARWVRSALAVIVVAFSLVFCIAVPLTSKLRREAINAQLVGVPGNDATVSIAYLPVPPKAAPAASTSCPGGYRVERGAVEPVTRKPSGGWRRRVRERRVGSGWEATVEGSGETATFELSVVCVR